MLINTRTSLTSASTGSTPLILSAFPFSRFPQLFGGCAYLKPHASQAGGHPRDSVGGDSLNVPIVFGVGLHAFLFLFVIYFQCLTSHINKKQKRKTHFNALIFLLYHANTCHNIASLNMLSFILSVPVIMWRHDRAISQCHLNGKC